MGRKRHGRATHEFGGNRDQCRRIPHTLQHFGLEPSLAPGDDIRRTPLARQLVASLPVSALHAAPRSHTRSLCSRPLDCASLYPLVYRLEANEPSVEAASLGKNPQAAGCCAVSSCDGSIPLCDGPSTEVGEAQRPTSLRDVGQGLRADDLQPRQLVRQCRRSGAHCASKVGYGDERLPEAQQVLRGNDTTRLAAQDDAARFQQDELDPVGDALPLPPRRVRQLMNLQTMGLRGGVDFTRAARNPQRRSAQAATC